MWSPQRLAEKKAPGVKSFLLSWGQGRRGMQLMLGIYNNTDSASLHLTLPLSTCLPPFREVGTPEVNGSSGHVSMCMASPYSPTRPIKARK